MKNSILLGIGLLFIIFSLYGCDTSFQPFQENNMYAFSIYGYLDASADTQWVRVAPARQQLNTPDSLHKIPDAQVTLEHLQSGKKVVLNDSLFTSGDGFNYLNFWTTMNIEEKQDYRLRAERADGKVSQVTVATPSELPTPRVQVQANYGQPTTYGVFIDDNVEHLIDVQAKWYVRFFQPGYEEKKLFTFSYKNEIEKIQAFGGVYNAELEPEVEEEEIASALPGNAEMEVLYRQIYVVSAGPDWNENIESMDDITYALPNSISNVENGLGYMVGVSSKTVPYASCFENGVLIACEAERPYW